MGVVYLGRDPEIGRPVALKCLRDSMFEENGKVNKGFQQDMLALGRLVHPNLVTLFDAGEDPSIRHSYIVMEFVEGSSLAGLMEEGRSLTLEQVRQLGIRICGAVDFAHPKGVIHRDIKRGNILPSSGLLVAEVTDFGIARLDSGGTTFSNAQLAR